MPVLLINSSKAMNQEMDDIHQAIDVFIKESGLKYTTPTAISPYLERKGLLKDSPNRKGLPLRKILRKGLIPQAFKQGHYWVIPPSKKD